MITTRYSFMYMLGGKLYIIYPLFAQTLVTVQDGISLQKSFFWEGTNESIRAKT